MNQCAYGCSYERISTVHASIFWINIYKVSFFFFFLVQLFSKFIEINGSDFTVDFSVLQFQIVLLDAHFCKNKIEPNKFNSKTNENSFGTVNGEHVFLCVCVWLVQLLKCKSDLENKITKKKTNLSFVSNSIRQTERKLFINDL